MFDVLVGIALVLNAVGICVLMGRVRALEDDVTLVNNTIPNILKGIFDEQQSVQLLIEHIFGKKGPSDR